LIAALLQRPAALPALLILTFLSRIIFMFRSEGSLASRLFLDDSYYVFSCARNLARGLGLSVDGIHPTNGLQPLIAYIYAPFFMLGGDDRWLGLRLTFIPLAIIDTISCFLVYSIVRRLDRTARSSITAIVASIVWFVAYPVWSETMNGLETGIYSCLLLACFRLVLRPDYLDRSVVLGMLLGFTVLARIDAVILVVMIVVVALIGHRYRAAALIAATSFLISLPWWWYNYSTFGSVMPSSGYAQSVGSIPFAENLTHLGASIADISFVLFSLPYFKVSSTIAGIWITIGAMLFLSILLYARRLRQEWTIDAKRAITLFLVFSSILAMIYVSLFHAPYFIHRYLQPLRIVILILASIAAVRLAYQQKLYRYGLSLFALCGVAFAAFQYQHIMRSETTGDLYKAGVWAREHPDYRIGMMQSGIAGFTADNVVNLDGKVNFAALQALRKDSLGQYIVQESFTHLMDWDRFVREMTIKATAAGGCYTLQDSVELVRMYRNCALK
jgi:hypothetical protein